MSDARPHRRLRLPRLRPWSHPRGFWAVSQEMGADFAMGPGLLCGFRRELFAVSFSDLGKRRRWVAFRADSACETARSCKWGSLALKVAHEAVQLRCRRGDVEHTGASAECGDRNTLAE